MSGGNLVVPIVLWGDVAPKHRATIVHALADSQTIVTGSEDGELIIWRLAIDNVNGEYRIIPRYLLVGHNRAISCICATGVDSGTTRFVSCSTDGKMCLWEAVDGRCVDSVMVGNMLRITAHQSNTRLLCIGDYPEILVMDPQDLNVLFTLSSRVEPDWMSSLCLLRPPNVVVGLSMSGMVKIWSLTDIDKRDSANPIYEDESKSIGVKNALSITCCAQNQRSLLVVSPYIWQIFDGADFSQLLQQKCTDECAGGAFIGIDRIAVWMRDGSVYLYQLPRSKLRGKEIHTAFGTHPVNLASHDNAFVYCKLNVQPSVASSALIPGANIFLDSKRIGPQQIIYAYRVDLSGRLAIWIIPNVAEKAIASLAQENIGFPEIMPKCEQTLDNVWNSLPERPSGIIDHLSDRKKITCTLYAASQGRLIIGRDDGSIVIVYACHAIIRQLLESKTDEWPQTRVLNGHTGAVICLLYPFEEHCRYKPQQLVSGGADFAVILWDLTTGVKLHRFCVQGGPILRLFMPPDNCNARILQTICSIAADHSVALLSLKENKCVLLASRHIYPVVEVRWRPLDDFMLVRCQDDSVFVWQMETASLDRIVTGLLAEEVLAACDEQVGVVEGDDEAGASSAVQMFRAFKNKSVAAMKRIAVGDDKNASMGDARDVVLPPPLLLQSLKTHKDDGDSHLLVFNIDALIMGLLAEEQSTTAGGSTTNEPTTIERIGTSTDPSASLSGLLSRSTAKEKSSTLVGNKAKPLMAAVECNLYADVARILMSLLHGWTLDNDLDHVCLRKLGLLRPKVPICFGLVSRQGHLSVLLPTGVESGVKFEDRFEQFARFIHWQLSSSMTTLHLLSVIATANTLMSMRHTTFFNDVDKKRSIRLSSSSSSNTVTGSRTSIDAQQQSLELQSQEQQHIKQGWSLLAALHCVLLPELVDKVTYCPPRIELLARRWQDRCLEIREAAQALLIREMNRLGLAGRKQLIDAWAPFLPTLLDDSLSIFGSRLMNALAMTSSSSMLSSSSQTLIVSSSAVAVSSSSSSTGTAGTTDSTIQQQRSLMPITALDITDPTQNGSRQSGLQQVRRNQATAIVLLGVIGSAFGAEITDANAPPSMSYTSTDRDQSLARATSQSLLELLIQPPTFLLPTHSPLRRAAIDLIGRGFVVWEPYLDISKVLLGLLDLAANSDKLLPTGPVIFPLSPVADACRTARHALSQIANARPPALITALSKEVARYNSAAQHQTIQHTVISPLLKSRTEVLRIIEQLADKQYAEVADLMIPVGEVLVHCLDTSLLKHRSLSEIFPPITKFYMVGYCPNTRRIAFGGKTGAVVIHELRAGKAQTIQAHTRSVTAVAFSEDGKHLATYSGDEGKINFWQTSQSFLGMGQSQIKCVKQQPAPSTCPVLTPGGSPLLFRARLVWINAKSLTLMLPNGKEHRFNVQ